MKNGLLLKQLLLYILLILSNLLALNKREQVFIQPNSGGQSAIRSNKREQVIIQPNSGGVYSVGAMSDIKWLTSQEADSITIEYTINSGNDWVRIDTVPRDTSDTTTYYWTIPAIKNSSDSCKIRIKNTTTDTVIDESEDFFTIKSEPATIKLVRPKKNEKISLTFGQKLEIIWSISGIPIIEHINIDMSIDTGKTWIVVALNVSSQGTYSIYIPYIPDGEIINGCLIKISDAVNPNKFDVTNVPFSIINTRNPINNNYYESYLFGIPSIKTNIVTQTLVINFSIKKRENVYIDFFSINGVRIHNISYGHIDKGTHSFKCNYSELLSGCFLFKINIGEVVFIKKIIHAK